MHGRSLSAPTAWNCRGRRFRRPVYAYRCVGTGRPGAAPYSRIAAHSRVGAAIGRPPEAKTYQSCHCEPVRTLARQSVTPVPVIAPGNDAARRAAGERILRFAQNDRIGTHTKAQGTVLCVLRHTEPSPVRNLRRTEPSPVRNLRRAEPSPVRMHVSHGRTSNACPYIPFLTRDSALTAPRSSPGRAAQRSPGRRGQRG